MGHYSPGPLRRCAQRFLIFIDVSLQGQVHDIQDAAAGLQGRADGHHAAQAATAEEAFSRPQKFGTKRSRVVEDLDGFGQISE